MSFWRCPPACLWPIRSIPPKALDSIAKRHRIVVQVFVLSRKMVDHIVNGVINSLSTVAVHRRVGEPGWVVLLPLPLRGEGASPQAQTRGNAPSPGMSAKDALIPTSRRKRER